MFWIATRAAAGRRNPRFARFFDLETKPAVEQIRWHRLRVHGALPAARESSASETPASLPQEKEHPVVVEQEGRLTVDL